MKLTTLSSSISLHDGGSLLGMIGWREHDTHIEVLTLHVTTPVALLRLMVEFRRLHAPAKVCYETSLDNEAMQRLGSLLGAVEADGRYWFALCRGGRDTSQARQET